MSPNSAIRLHEQGLEQSSDRIAKMTIFSIPKAFDGHIGLIQRNAIKSWKKLSEKFPVQVVLFGDELGTAEAAKEIGVEHISGIETNEQGTPLLNDCFAKVHSEFESPYFCYINCDIILLDNIFEVILQFENREFKDFLAIGRRIDLDIQESLQFDQNDELEDLCQSSGTLAPVVCKDYFLFPEHLYQNIPAFSVGRGNWDNWMVSNANKNKIPVVDLTEVVTAIHQNHDYRHLGGGRLAAYVTGTEAKENSKLAGGKNLVSGATSKIKLTKENGEFEFQKVKGSPFWSDLPNFLKLIGNLFLKKRA